MKIREHCTRNVISAKADCTITEAARLMRKHHVGCLVIVSDDGKSLPTGIVTDRDIVIEVLAEEISMETVTVKDIMTHSLILAAEEDDILDALQLMEDHGVRRLPVINSKNELTGLLSLNDILKVVEELLDVILSTYKREQSQENKLRP